MENKESKFKSFCAANKTILISAGIVLVLAIFAFIIYGVWPFGKNTVAIYDLSWQVLPLSNLVFDIFQGKATLFYSNRIAGGMCIFSGLLYFIMSPFFLILLIGGRANVFFTINLVLLVYLLAIAISISFAIKKLFPKLNPAMQIILSIAYTFSGYVVINYTYMVWLNFMILVPLMTIQFKNMIETGKYKWFSILTFLFIISCFGIGSVSQFILLAIYYVFILVCVEKEKRGKALVTLTIAMLVAVLFSTIIIVPAFLESFDGMRQGQLFSYIFNSNLPTRFNVKLSFLIVNFAFCFISILHLIFSDKKDKLNLFLAITTIPCCLITIIDTAMLILNFGLYIGYVNRLGMISTILLFLSTTKFIYDVNKNLDKKICKKIIKNNKKIIIKNYDKNSNKLIFSKNNKNSIKNDENSAKIHKNEINNENKIKNKNIISNDNSINRRTRKRAMKYLILTWTGLAILSVLLLYANGSTLSGVKTLFKNLSIRMAVETITSSTIIFCFGIFLVFFLQLLISFLIYKNSHYKKILKMGLSVFLIGQIALGYVIFAGNNYDTNKFTANYELSENIEDYDRARTFGTNMQIYCDYSDITAFSSMLSEKNFTAFSNLGYEGISNSIENTGGTLFTHTILGIKYFHTSQEIPNTRFLELVDSKISQDEEFYLYRYKYQTSGAFLVHELFKWDEKLGVFENENLFAKSLGATKNIFDVYTFEDLLNNSVYGIDASISNITKNENCYTTGADSKINLKLADENSICYYILPPEIYNSAITMTCKEPHNSGTIQNLSEGHTKELEITLAKNKNYDLSSIKIGMLDLDIFEEEFEKIKFNEVEINYKKNGMECTARDLDGEKFLFISNANIHGMKAKVNKKDAKIYDFASGFIAVELNQGDNNISVEYHYPYLIPWIVITFISIGMAILIIITFKKFKQFYFKFEGFCRVIYCIYLIGFVCIIFGFGSVVTIINLF